MAKLKGSSSTPVSNEDTSESVKKSKNIEEDGGATEDGEIIGEEGTQVEQFRSVGRVKRLRRLRRLLRLRNESGEFKLLNTIVVLIVIGFILYYLLELRKNSKKNTI